MQNVPKIVVERLRSPTAESHPDADQLTAFAEHSLAGRERVYVVEHLARCGECREIVALALPATEAAAAGKSESAARIGWFTWPILRWGVVAAGLVAVTSVGIQQYRERREGKMVSTSLMARTQVAETVGQSLPQSPPTSQTTLPPGEAGKPMETRKKAAPRAQGVPDGKKTDLSANAIFPQSNAFHGRVSGGAGGGASAGASFGGPITGRTTSNRDFAFTTAPKIAPPVPTAKQNTIPLTTSESVVVPHNSEVVELQSEAASIATQSAASPSQDQLLQNEPSGRVGKAKPALEQAYSAPPAPVLRADSRLMKTPAAPPRWTISSNGALQRSFDGGKTWLDVNIAADNSMSFNLVNRSQSEMVTVEARSETKTASGAQTKADAKTGTKNDADAKVRSKAPSAAKSAAPSAAKSAEKSADNAAPAVSPTVFRALSVSSDSVEIWAGGTGGALYHTIDGGDLWVRVVPSGAGIALTGDIVGIQFSDPRNGTVTTSNAEVWATSDGGQSWRKQR